MCMADTMNIGSIRMGAVSNHPRLRDDHVVLATSNIRSTKELQSRLSPFLCFTI
jgi:hypothetical protein